VSGNIGSGKTTLCNYLKENLPGSKVYFEKFELNEHLQPFYEYIVNDTGKGNPYNPHALPVQVGFLLQRVRLERELDKEILEREKFLSGQKPGGDTPTSGQGKTPIEIHVIDRSIFEDNEIFAKNQLDSGMMTREEYEEYLKVYDKHIGEIMSPDLMVILNQDPKVLHERVMKRGREMEKGMSVDYLANLQERYFNSLEPFLKNKGVIYFRQSPNSPKDVASANQEILEAIKKEFLENN
jgi:deoxyadenosine/deoxycytidine kinase